MNQKISITWKGKTHTATIADECMGYVQQHTRHAFDDSFAGTGAGELYGVNWPLLPW
jgi:hypothetical protein